MKSQGLVTEEWIRLVLAVRRKFGYQQRVRLGEFLKIWPHMVFFFFFSNKYICCLVFKTKSNVVLYFLFFK